MKGIDLSLFVAIYQDATKKSPQVAKELSQYELKYKHQQELPVKPLLDILKKYNLDHILDDWGVDANVQEVKKVAKTNWGVVRKLVRAEIKRIIHGQQQAKPIEELSQDEKSAQVKANQADIEARKVALANAQKRLKATQAAPTDQV